MHIAHIVTDDSRSANGVRQKIERTVKAWRSFGANVDFIDAASGDVVDDIESIRSNATAPRVRAMWLLDQQRRAERLHGTLDRLSPDVVYSRQLVWTPRVERLVRTHPFFFEINGDATSELRSRSRLASAYWRWTSRRLLDRAQGVVAVTEELLRDQVGERVRSIVLGNGADVPDQPPLRNPSSPPTVLLLLGEPEQKPVGPHRGLDRLAELSSTLPEYRFVVRGGRPPEAQKDRGRIEFLPRVFGPQLAEELASATVCIGALAPHRHHLSTASSLKLRTALAAGVPVISASSDPHLAGADDVVLQIPAEDGFAPADIDRIRRFIDRVHDDRDLDRKAWDFALAHFSTHTIERRRLEFLFPRAKASSS